MCLILFLSSQMAILTTTLCLFYKSVCCLQFCKLWILPVTSTPEKCQRHHTSVRTESMQFKLTWESTVYNCMTLKNYFWNHMCKACPSLNHGESPSLALEQFYQVFLQHICLGFGCMGICMLYFTHPSMISQRQADLTFVSYASPWKVTAVFLSTSSSYVMTPFFSRQ